jgi:hypothetical protein
MKKTVKSWTNNQTRIVAIEVPSHTTANNCFDLSPTNENHWAARVVKDKQAFLNDEELSEFLQKVRNATCAFFRINIEGSAYFYIMMLQKFKSIYFSSIANFHQAFETCLQNYENQVNCLC